MSLTKKKWYRSNGQIDKFKCAKVFTITILIVQAIFSTSFCDVYLNGMAFLTCGVYSFFSLFPHIHSLWVLCVCVCGLKLSSSLLTLSEIPSFLYNNRWKGTHSNSLIWKKEYKDEKVREWNDIYKVTC